MKYAKYFSILVILVFVACGKSNDKSNYSDIITVRHAGADMPAYIYGNITENTFLIILHGGPGSSGLEYRIGTYAETLEKEMGVVYLDQRGQGMSQGSYNGDKNTPQEMAKDINALALVLKEKFGNDVKLFLMGHSWGGTLGSTVIANSDYQKHFKGWIEADGAHNFPLLYRSALRLFDTIGTEQIQLGNSADYWKKTIEKIRALDSTELDFNTMNQEAYTAEANLLADNVLAPINNDQAAKATGTLLYGNNILTSWFSGTATALSLEKNNLTNYSVSDKFLNIKIPTLLLWGRYDLVVPLELGYEAYNKIGSTDKELIIYEQSGHSPMNNEADKFAQDIINFVEKYK